LLADDTIVDDEEGTDWLNPRGQAPVVNGSLQFQDFSACGEDGRAQGT